MNTGLLLILVVIVVVVVLIVTAANRRKKQQGITVAGPAAPPGASAYPYPHTNTLSIVSFVLSFFVSIPAIVCGHIALSQIKRTNENGWGLAVAALVIGYIELIASIIYLIYLIS